MENSLPKGWVETTLESCCDILDNLRMPVNAEERAKRLGDVPYYGATGQVGWIDEFLFDEDIVLIGEDGAPFFDKSKNIAFRVTGKSWVNNHAHVLKANTATTNKFLEHYLNNFDYNGYVNGTTRLKLTQGKLKEIPVTLPPLAEQNRIVAKLDALLARVTNSKNRLEKIPALLKNFRQSVLAAAVSGELTKDWREKNKVGSVDKLIANIEKAIDKRHQQETELAMKMGKRKPKDHRNNKKASLHETELPELPELWKYKRLEELTYLVTDGTHRTPVYKSEGVKFLSVKNVRPFKIKDGDIKFISKEEHKEINSRCNPEKGDILYTKVGATFGYAAINNLEYPFSIFVSLALIKPVYEFLNSKFIEAVMNSEIVFKQARERVSGIGTPDLHLIEIRDFKIPICSLEEQKEIVRKVEELFHFADSIDARYLKAKAWFDKLPQAILAKAFRGELVEQDENDEPASVLLERIKKEKQNTNKPKPTAKRKKVYEENEGVSLAAEE